MARLSNYDYERLEDIMDNLREEGCPEDEIMETARMMLAESESIGCDHMSFLDEENPFWEPMSGGIEAEFEEAGFQIEEEPHYDPWYYPLRTRCTLV